MRPTVDKVESSIKGGGKAKRGRKTLVLGANGLGKSAIVNAVELAGTGKASDVAGRSVLAKDADLFMLAPPGADHVSAPAHPLTTPLEKARAEVRTCNASAKTLRSLSPPSQPPPNPQEISALEAIVSAWQARKGADSTSESAVAILKEALETRRGQISSLEGRSSKLEGQLAQLPKPQGNLDVLRSAIVVVETIAAGHFARCPICEGKVDLEAMKTKCATGKAKIAQLSELADKRLELVRTQDAILSELRMARRGADTLATEFARAEKAVKKDDSPVPAMSLDAAQAQLRSLAILKAGWDGSQRAEERALAAESDAHEWSQLADALSKALGVLVEKACAGFVKKVQRYLPREDLFGVELLDGEREILRVGLMRLAGDHMVLHAALSGAEWARVTAALALAVAPTSGACVVCPEERAFDPDTLSSVLAAFGAALDDVMGRGDGPQVIVTSPNPPREVPPGWTVIPPGKGESRKWQINRQFLRTSPQSRPQQPICRGSSNRYLPGTWRGSKWYC